MSRIEAFDRKYLTPILLVLLAGGFLVVLGELFLYRHWDGVQLIGFSATIAGLLFVVLGIFAKGGLRKALAVLLVLLSVSGLIGAYEHLESANGEGGEAQRPVLEQVASSNAALALAVQPRSDLERAPAQEGNESGEGQGGGEAAPPPLAPLSLSGLALMGAAILFAKQDQPAKTPA